MKLMAQLAVIGALVAGATALNAQTNSDVTVNISLNGVVGTNGTSARGRISTRDVIVALKPDAAKNAKLILRSTVGGDETFLIREGTNDTLVSGLTTTRIGTAVTTVKIAGNGTTTEKTTEIREFVLSNTVNGLTFDVQGYTTSTADNRGPLRGETFGDTTNVVAASAKVSGTMTDIAGDPGVVQGTITVGGRKITETP